MLVTTPNIARQANIDLLQRGENILAPLREDAPADRDVTDFVAHIREYSVREVVDLVDGAGLRVAELAMCNLMGEPLDADPLRNRYTCILAVKR